MELMNRYLDADLNELESAHLMEHLKQCSDCSEMFERLRHLSAELENMPKVMPKYSLVDAIMPQLDQIDRERELPEKSPQKVVPMKPRFWERLSFRSIGGVVAAGIIVGLFMVTYKPDTAQQADMELMSSQESAAADQKVEMQIDASSPSTSQPKAGSADQAVSQDVVTGTEKKDAEKPDARSADTAPKEEPTVAGTKSGATGDAAKAHQGNTDSSGGTSSNQGTADSKSVVGSKSGNDSSKVGALPNPVPPTKQEQDQQGTDGDSQRNVGGTSSDATLEDGQPVTVEIGSGEPRSLKSDAGDKGGNNLLSLVEYDTANPDSRAEVATSNGAYRAVFEKNKFMIYNAKDKEVYHQKLTNGVFSNPLWAEDNKTLTYTFTPRKADGQMGEEQVIQVKVKAKDKEKQQEKQQEKGKKSKS
nr:zf-HC2 domain-containing protein [Paenibacillus terrigena]